MKPHEMREMAEDELQHHHDGLMDELVNLKIKLADACSNGARATNGAAGSVEGGEKTITRAFDFLTPMALDLRFSDPIVLVQKIAPFPVTQSRQTFTGGDYVGEHNRREDSFRTHLFVMLSSQELFHGMRDLLQLLCRKERQSMILAGRLDVPRARNMIGEISPVSDRNELVRSLMQNERGHTNTR